MVSTNKGRLYSALIVVSLILSIAATIILGEAKQAKLIKENIELSEKLSKTEPTVRDTFKEKQGSTDPENLSGEDPDNQEERLVYSTDNINVRSGPGTNYSILASLPAFQRVTLVEEESNGWSKIIFNNKEGYCYSSYLTEEEGEN